MSESTNSTAHILATFAAGFLFSIGLGVGGMTQPAKVVNFLDITGSWDPSLAFVMLGAIAVHTVAYRLVPRMGSPLLSARFGIPTRRDINPRLIVGATLFGAGWGLGGFCPGPALVSVSAGTRSTLTFVAAMLGGMLLFHLFEAAMSASAKPAAYPPGAGRQNPQ